jgi:hypothetical protein
MKLVRRYLNYHTFNTLEHNFFNKLPDQMRANCGAFCARARNSSLERNHRSPETPNQPDQLGIDCKSLKTIAYRLLKIENPL